MAGPERSSLENPESNRESLTGVIQAPFALREPTEKSKEYSLVFMQHLTKNWADVCTLMDWKKDGAAIDISIFKLAKDPVQVVRSIQAAIVARGGKLEKYGQDGKFGRETEAGLKQALSSLSAAPTERRPERLALTMPNFEALVDVVKASDERLKAAGLDIKGIDKTAVTPDIILAYKVKARAFRESLGRENPLLAKLCPIADEMIKIIEEEIKKIDISSVKNHQDFNDTIRGLAQSIESKMEEKEAQFEQIITEAEKAQLKQMMKDGLEFKNLDQLELPMAFLMSAMNELALTAMEHFGKDPDAIENFMELMRIDRMIPRKPAVPSLQVEEGPITQDEMWSQLVEHGPYQKTDGSLYFNHVLPNKETPLVFFDWSGTITIGGHVGLLKLPMGAELTSLEAFGNGDIKVTGALSGLKREVRITQTELRQFLTDLGTGKPGPLSLAGLEVTVVA